nr:MAG TPA: hypothetical protein [Bacteriophage sp.]
MKLKECLIFLLAINLNPLGLWLNSLVVNNFINQQDHNIQNDEKHLPSTSCNSQKEHVKQYVIR